MLRHKVSISIKDSHIYEYLKSKDNISSYICRLVEADMQKAQTNDGDFDTKVEKVLYKLLQNSNLQIKESLPVEENQSSTEPLTSEDIEIINNLF